MLYKIGFLLTYLSLSLPKSQGPFGLVLRSVNRRIIECVRVGSTPDRKIALSATGKEVLNLSPQQIHRGFELVKNHVSFLPGFQDVYLQRKSRYDTSNFTLDSRLNHRTTLRTHYDGLYETLG